MCVCMCVTVLQEGVECGSEVTLITESNTEVSGGGGWGGIEVSEPATETLNEQRLREIQVLKGVAV